MKLHQLRYLVAVASEGGIRAAARSLGVTQATVTQGLRELEAHAQVALIARRGSHVALTPAGQALLAHAQRMLSEMRQAEGMLARHRDTGAPQRLALAITPWVAQTLLPRVLPAFRQELPHVQLEMFDGLSALGYPRLREGSLDLLIGRLGPTESMQGLHAQPMFRYEMTVVARRGHPRAAARSMAELLDEDWVLNFTAGERVNLLDNLFVQHGLAPPVHRIQLAHSASLMLGLVRKTDMLTFCPWPLVEGDALRDEVVALPLRERFHSHAVGLVRRSHEGLSHAAGRFVAHFQGQLAGWMSSDEPELRRVLHSVEFVGEWPADGPAPGRD